MSTSDASPSDWDLAYLLAEPTRRHVFDVVRAAREPLTRDDVARLSGVNRRLASFHLDRLSQAGLLLTDYVRPAGRTGPGAGRPAKRYAASAVELHLSVPARHYDIAARLLARAIDTAPTRADKQALIIAREEGKRIGTLRRPASRRRTRRAAWTLLTDLLTELGYEPAHRAGEALQLRNCPFRTAADIAPALVCGMNCELLTGILEGLGESRLRASLTPTATDCCVTVTGAVGGRPRTQV